MQQRAATRSHGDIMGARMRLKTSSTGSLTCALEKDACFHVQIWTSSMDSVSCALEHDTLICSPKCIGLLIMKIVFGEVTVQATYAG